MAITQEEKMLFGFPVTETNSIPQDEIFFELGKLEDYIIRKNLSVQTINELVNLIINLPDGWSLTIRKGINQ